MSLEPLEDMCAYVCCFCICIQFTIDDFKISKFDRIVNMVVTVAAAALLVISQLFPEARTGLCNMVRSYFKQT